MDAANHVTGPLVTAIGARSPMMLAVRNGGPVDIVGKAMRDFQDANRAIADIGRHAFALENSRANACDPSSRKSDKASDLFGVKRGALRAETD